MLTDERLSSLYQVATIVALALFGILCGIMFKAGEASLWLVVGAICAGAAGAGAMALREKVLSRETAKDLYSRGQADGRREMINAGRYRAAEPQPTESMLPTEFADDLEAMAANIEEGKRFFQAAIEHNAAMRRSLAGVNLHTSELKIQLAQAQARAARAEAALQGIQDGLRRYTYAPDPIEASPAEAAPVPVPEVPDVALAAVENALAGSTSKSNGHASPVISPFTLSLPDDGEPSPAFLSAEPRAIDVDLRKTEDALIRLADLGRPRAWPIAETPAYAGA